MDTVNISLTKTQVQMIDKLISLYGFANRSEFVRSILRLIRYKPQLLVQATTFPFIAPKEKSVPKIISDFKKTKKYSDGFLKDLEEGLKSSEYFQK